MGRCDLSAVGGSASVPGGVEEASWLWRVSILFWKEHENALHLSNDDVVSVKTHCVSKLCIFVSLCSQKEIMGGNYKGSHLANMFFTIS